MSSIPNTPPTTNASTAPEAMIEQRINQTRRHVKGVELVEGLLTLGIGTLGYLLATAVIDHWLIAGGLGFWGRLALWLILLSGAGAFFVVRLLPPLVYRINPLFAAATIEQSRPSLKNGLVNFLLFRKRREAVAPIVYHAMEQRAANQLAEVEIDVAVDRAQVIRLGFVLAGIVAVFSLYLVASPKNPMRSAARVLWPWANVEAATRVTIHNVQPGDATAFLGDPVMIEAEVAGLNEGEQVLAIYSTADGQTVEQAVPMTLPEGDYRYQCSLPPDKMGLQQDLIYYLKGGDCQTPRYRIAAQVAPRIDIDRVIYHYPSYTGIADHTAEGEGDLIAVEGTEVTIQATANTDIKPFSAEIDRGCTGTQGIRMTIDGRTAVGSFTLRMSPKDPTVAEYDTYQLRFADMQGRENRQPIRYRIEVIRDLPPTVEVIEPKEKEVKTPLGGKRAIRVRAQDPDFGLRRVGVQAQWEEKPLKIAPLWERKSTEAVRQGEYVGTYEFQPKPLGLKAGDRVEYWAEAADGREEPGVGVGMSEKRWIEIVEDEKPSADERAGMQPPTPKEEQGASENKSGENSQESNQGQGENQSSEQGEQGGENQSKGQASENASQQNQEGQPGGEGQQNGQKNSESSGQGQEKGEQQGQDASGQEKQEPGGQQGKGQSSGQQQQQGGPSGQSGQKDQKIDPDVAPGDAMQEILNDRQDQRDQPSSKQDQGSQGPSGGEKSSQGANGKGQPSKEQQDQQASEEQGRAGESGKSKPSEQHGSDKSGERENGSTEQGRAGERGQRQAAEEKQGDASKEGRSKQGENGKPTKEGEADNKPGKGQNVGNEAGVPEALNQNKPHEKQAGKPDEAPAEQNGDQAQSPSISKEQSDSESDTAGDRSGGGEKGGGQRADRQGAGTEGEHQPAEEGAGQAAEPGKGETGDKAGDQTTSESPTGSSEKTAADQQGAEKTDKSGEANQGKPTQGKDGKESPEKGQPGRAPGDSGNGTPTGGGQPTATSKSSTPPEEADVGADQANLDYAQRQSTLALEYLRDQLAKEDPKVLERLGWSREEAERFLNRWEAMRRAANENQADAASKKNYENALRSLGLRPGGTELRHGSLEKDNPQPLRDAGRFAPPPEYMEQFREYTRGVAEGKKKEK